MRNRVKYMALVAIVVVAVLAIVLVSCNSGGDPVAKTTEWLASAENATVTDTVTLTDLKINAPEFGYIGGSEPVISIDSVDIVATRVIKGDNLDLTLEIKNIKGFKFTSKIDDLLKTLSGVIKDFDLNKIKNIGDIDSLKVVLNYTPAADIVLTGEFHGYGLNAFLDGMPEGDSNPNNEKFLNLAKTEVTGEDHAREAAIISSIMDLLDNPIYGAAAFDDKGKSTANLSNIVAVASKALELYGSDKIYNGETPTDYDANAILNMIFNSTKIDTIINNLVSISSLTMTNNTTQTVNKQKVFASTELTANLDIEFTAADMARVKKNLSNILGAFGVDLGAADSIVGLLLKGEVTIEANVKVVTNYANN